MTPGRCPACGREVAMDGGEAMEARRVTIRVSRGMVYMSTRDRDGAPLTVVCEAGKVPPVDGAGMAYLPHEAFCPGAKGGGLNA